MTKRKKIFFTVVLCLFGFATGSLAALIYSLLFGGLT